MEHRGKVLAIAVFLTVVAGISGGLLLNYSPTEESGPETKLSNGTAEEKPEKAGCDEIEISIDSVSGETALVRQINGKPVGNVNATWQYVNGATVTKSATLAERGEMVFIESGTSGTVESFSLKPVRCPDRVFSGGGTG